MRLSLARVAQGYRAQFAAELERLFRPDLGAVADIAGDQAVRLLFQECLSRSEAAGFALQGEIVKFAFVAVHLGLGFDRDPLWEGLRDDALWDHPGAHPNVGLNRMFDAADLLIAEGMAGADLGYPPGFPEACAQTAPDASLAAVAAICAAANPKRAAAVGDAAIHAALLSALHDLDQQHPRFAAHRAGWMLCSYFLGHGFARNPVHAWAAWALDEGGPALIRRRLHV